MRSTAGGPGDRQSLRTVPSFCLTASMALVGLPREAGWGASSYSRPLFPCSSTPHLLIWFILEIQKQEKQKSRTATKLNSKFKFLTFIAGASGQMMADDRPHRSTQLHPRPLKHGRRLRPGTHVTAPPPTGKSHSTFTGSLLERTL